MDGYAGYEELYRDHGITEVACMALAIVLGPMADKGSFRRTFVDVQRSQGSAIAEEAILRISQLYAVEKEARGSPPDQRAAIRQAKAKPVFDDLQEWLDRQLTTISGKSPLAQAIRYALTRMRRLKPYLANGILELDNDTAERAIRAVALGRKNYSLSDHPPVAAPPPWHTH